MRGLTKAKPQLSIFFCNYSNLTLKMQRPSMFLFFNFGVKKILNEHVKTSMIQYVSQRID